MANENRIAGTFNLTIDGETWKVKGSASINLGQPKREAVVGQDGVHGYKEIPQAPGIRCEISTMPGVSIKDKILNMTNSTVSISAANGSTYFVEKAFFVGDGEIETEDGKLSFECQGFSADEVVA